MFIGNICIFAHQSGQKSHHDFIEKSMKMSVDEFKRELKLIKGLFKWLPLEQCEVMTQIEILKWLKLGFFFSTGLCLYGLAVPHH